MVVKPEQERVRNLLTDTVTLLCKNGLTYNKEMKVQGLLGITLDEDEVFVVHIDEKFEDMIAGKDLTSIQFSDTLELDKDSETSSKKRRKRRNSRDSDTGSNAGTATPSKRNRDSNSQDSLDTVRIKQEKADDVICIDSNDIKPDPLRGASSLQQTSQPYVTGMVASAANTSHISDNSNASWDGSSQLQQINQFDSGGLNPGGSAAWNAQNTSLFDNAIGLSDSYDPSTGAIKTKYMCLFSGCGLKFTHKRHARRHQNAKHGRIPIRTGRNSTLDAFRNLGFYGRMEENMTLSDQNYISDITDSILNENSERKQEGSVQSQSKKDNSKPSEKKKDNSIEFESRQDNSIEYESRQDDSIDFENKQDDSMHYESSLDIIKSESEKDQLILSESKQSDSIQSESKPDNSVQLENKQNNSACSVSKQDDSIESGSRQDDRTQSDSRPEEWFEEMKNIWYKKESEEGSKDLISHMTVKEEKT